MRGDDDDVALHEQAQPPQRLRHAAGGELPCAREEEGDEAGNRGQIDGEDNPRLGVSEPIEVPDIRLLFSEGCVEILSGVSVQRRCRRRYFRAVR